jgi:putative glycerol-1-phosphate prenyltransferase
MSEVYLNLLKKNNGRGPGFFLLLDPDKIAIDKLIEIIGSAIINGIDGFLIGSSLLFSQEFQEFVTTTKKLAQQTPVILFPGNSMQISTKADAILFLSLLSGRNPEYIISQQVLAAPIIKRSGIESISTAYLLIESGQSTAVQFMSNTTPIPANKPDIVAAHAIAAEMMGFKCIYLEAGSGALNPVPNIVIKTVKDNCSLPIIVGGGIRDPETAAQKVKAGANFIVCGNFFEDNKFNMQILAEIADAVHYGNK